MKHKLVLAALILFGCENATQPPPDNRYKLAVAGEWTETLPANRYYYAGASFKFTFAQDSVTITEKKWTDFTDCFKTDKDTVGVCTDGQWENTYRGMYTLDSNRIDVDMIFTKTTANAITDNEKMKDGPVRFRYRIETSSTGNLILEPESTSVEFFTGKDDSLLLKKPVR